MKPLMLAVLMTLLAASPAPAAGPWKGEVVDGASRQPLPGVIVFAVWWKKFPALVHERSRPLPHWRERSSRRR